MPQSHQSKDVGLVLAYFSRIPLCAYRRKGWMVVSMLCFDSTVKSNIAVGFILDFSPSSPLRWWLYQGQWVYQQLPIHFPCTVHGMTQHLVVSNCVNQQSVGNTGGKIWGRNDFVSFRNQTVQNKILFPLVLKVLYDNCWASVVRLCFGEHFCFHWGKTVSLWKAQLTLAQGCNVVWQIKSLETKFSFIESLLQSSFRVHDFLRSMLSCVSQNFILHSNIQHWIQKFPSSTSGKKWDSTKRKWITKDLRFLRLLWLNLTDQQLMTVLQTSAAHGLPSMLVPTSSGTHRRPWTCQLQQTPQFCYCCLWGTYL